MSAVLVFSLILWVAAAWSIADAGRSLRSHDWLELTWGTSRSAMLVFLAVAAGAAHANPGT